MFIMWLSGQDRKHRCRMARFRHKYITTIEDKLVMIFRLIFISHNFSEVVTLSHAS
jgi:hypothetical protein